jgi:hypothetical protein
MRSVIAQVRASKKEPSEPSYFVSGILKPLKAYLDGPASVLDDELKRQWATEIVADVASRYVPFLIFTVRRMYNLTGIAIGMHRL